MDRKLIIIALFIVLAGMVIAAAIPGLHDFGRTPHLAQTPAPEIQDSFTVESPGPVSNVIPVPPASPSAQNALSPVEPDTNTSKSPVAVAKLAPRTPIASAAAPAEAENLPRLALGWVGADAAAEAVWYQAINDPTRSAHERQDLIEDLNEEGFADPKNLTPDDLPLIESRLEIIEAVAPTAIDEVNANAFAEAYKDLLDMRARLLPR